MKKFVLPKKVETIFGKPFRINDYKHLSKEIAYRCEHCGKDSKVLEPKFIEEAGMIDLLTFLVMFGFGREKPPTMKDSIEAGRFMEQVRQTKNSVLELEEAEHDWVKEKVEELGPVMYGINASVIRDFLDNFERLHEKKEKKGKQEVEEEVEEE